MNAASGSSIIGQHARHGRLLELSEAATTVACLMGRGHGSKAGKKSATQPAANLFLHNPKP